MPNYDAKTGTPYGVVHINTLTDWVLEEFLNEGRNLSESDALAEWRVENPDPTYDEEDEFRNSLEIEEPEIELETDGMKLGLSWLGGAPLVWVYESPHTMSCRPCSPCIPGAGDLDSPVEAGFGIVAYSLPDEWFGEELLGRIQREGVE